MTALNAARRTRELSELAENPSVDLLVVGGGVTGAGVALDAASRGLRVVLAEKHDLAFGTSRWSSKLVHGGLRYLATGNVGIAYESAVERRVLMERTAPHLVRPLPQLLPLVAGIGAGRAALVGAGFVAGDLLRRGSGTAGSTLPAPRRVSRVETKRMVPTLRHDRLRGGLLSWDGQLVDDARLVVGLARTAAAHGATVLTRCAAEQVTGEGAVLRDRLGGGEIAVRARSVINAAGVWAGEVAPGLRLRPSRGTHLVVSDELFGGLGAGVTVPVPGTSNRFALALPAGNGRVYIGLTDEEQHGPIPDVPTASEQEVEFLLDTVNSVLARPIRRDEVLGTYSGLRPLLDGGEGSSADLSREHAVRTGPDGVTSVVGGKLTTYRKMAQDAVDAAAIARNPCRTRNLPLIGAATAARLSAVDAPRDLVARYGTEAPAVVAAADGDPRLLEPIAGLGLRPAELRFAVRNEGALDVADLLDRRTRVGLVPADRERAVPAAEAALRAG
ncbi:MULTISPECIES: glycerol-3-phosphate dehydrogenase/oxidase [unclassified Saccharopolyspora]|uniref:glycerol-3-phosphate dehydrogenase/oxidase n=1 Tax=unclassified Saccharopolyspora TaxID=2646250 RepID=UPI001CD60787|nr:MULTISPECIES: glycerol-3-phosphate dehydrogenase/oxidase [unclassified Saccharopolyspora]MCA1190082.1 glycerol-3-phosphate dehydrogenase/oxidase [Saccharopolyspora sp. 6T]MCA1191945.1 glycerol-3-phosphate dehydrogenase/oxidase [Saccharopolyspora sp. 6V]MCA1224868.1 glycerol-3-phosphate dehydrogenase/oxidase [Saccharopolyspora sp. 6M]MCA1279787.1 glycerol-3-phosphate dehydrogenase/oxidase [Saccharopolyspora sp. 7B]